MYKKNISLILVILLIFTTVFIKPSEVVKADADTGIFSNYSVYPADYSGYNDESKIPANVSVYQPIKITFNDIKSGLTISDENKITVSNTDLQFSKNVVGNSLLLTPKTKLKYGQIYDFSFTIGAGAISYSGSSNLTDITVGHVKFKTEYSLNDLITTNGIDDLLKNKLPKDLNIFIEQYILNIAVNNTNVNNSNFTSIDINKHPDAAEVDVNDRKAQIPSNNLNIFNVGFFGLADGADIKVSVKDFGGRELESRTVKLNASKSKDVTAIKDVSTHGKPYSLQDLINNKTLFKTVLDNSKTGSNTSLRENISFDDVSIDIENGQILNTTTDMEYSLTSNTGTSGTFLPCKEGSTSGITFTAGRSVCVRERNNYKNYVLIPVSKDVSGAPKFTIDYKNETTIETVPASIEYAQDSLFSVNRNDGTGSTVSLTPGKTYYFRYKATNSTVAGQAFRLAVPARPKQPLINVDYNTLKTKQTVPNTVEYSQDATFKTGINYGNGNQISLIQDKTYYFRYSAIVGRTFASDSVKIDVTNSTNRPTAPSYTIDYLDETTKESVPNTVEYVEYAKGKTLPDNDDNADFSRSLNGSGRPLILRPGSTYYFRVKVTQNNFASSVFKLTVPDRPEAPAFIIDYVNEKIDTTFDNVSKYEYSFDNFRTICDCSVKNSLKGKYGLILYVRKKAIADTSFKGQMQTIFIPTIQPTNYNIDYTKGVITVPNGEDMEWSNDANMSSPTTITGGNSLELDPSTAIRYIYVRAKASNLNCFFTKSIKKIAVPARPAAVKYTVNYIAGTTTQVVGTNMEYIESISKITDGDLWDSSKFFNKYTFISGQGKPVNLNKGKYYYFRVKGTANNFPGYVSEIDFSNATVPDKPSYSIDYSNETTNEIVPTTVEYAEDENFTVNKKSGMNQKVTLEPGKNLYFRVKGTATTLPGTAYELVVNPRQAKPTFLIDYVNETTNITADSSYEYSFDNFKSIVSGNGEKIPLNPGDADKTLSIRKKGTATDFSGEIQNIVIPRRPKTNFTINFNTGETNEVVGTNVEWAYNESFSGVQTGDGKPLTITSSDKEQYIYFRIKAKDNGDGTGNFIGSAQMIKIPVVPQYTIDYINETTNEIVPTAVEYAEDSNFTINKVTGADKKVALVPGKTYYFRTKATDTTSAGKAFTLVVKSRESKPNFTIDYLNEKTKEIVDETYEYSYDNFKSIISGMKDQKVIFNPGDDDKILTIRKKATVTAFSGEIQTIVIPARPKVNLTIDFAEGKTNEALATNVQWADNEAFIGATFGNGSPMSITPSDKDKYIYFKINAKDNNDGTGNFVSNIQMIKIPAKPATPVFTVDTATFMTKEAVGTNIEYCVVDNESSPDFSPQNVILGRGQVIDLSHYKGKTIYFRIKESSTNFEGTVTKLNVPNS